MTPLILRKPRRPLASTKALGKMSRPTHKVPNEEGANEKGIHVLPIQVIPNTYASKWHPKHRHRFTNVVRLHHTRSHRHTTRYRISSKSIVHLTNLQSWGLPQASNRVPNTHGEHFQESRKYVTQTNGQMRSRDITLILHKSLDKSGLTTLPAYPRDSSNVRFDYGFKSMNRQEARGACIERLRLMGISLGSTYSNPIDVGLNAVTKQWAGFIKVHLQKPHLDGLTLLIGNRAFVMVMEDGENVIEM